MKSEITMMKKSEVILEIASEYLVNFPARYDNKMPNWSEAQSMAEELLTKLEELGMLEFEDEK
jgi:hypothetical protein